MKKQAISSFIDELLQDKGFIVMDSNDRVTYRKDNVDVIIEIVEHKDKLK